MKCLQQPSTIRTGILSLSTTATATNANELNLPKKVSDLIKDQKQDEIFASKQRVVVNPLKSEDFFQVKSLVKLEELYK